MNMFVLWEAINSGALSHEEGHDCDTCKAASGDKDALHRVMVMVSLPPSEQPQTEKED